MQRISSGTKPPDPDGESNGLALCALHHKLFDLVTFTVDREGVLRMSDQAHGKEGFEEVLLRFHGQRPRLSQRPEWTPTVSHLEWHGREVFRGSARHAAPSRRANRAPGRCRAGSSPAARLLASY
jgi:putative restriction endonuclease